MKDRAAIDVSLEMLCIEGGGGWCVAKARLTRRWNSLKVGLCMYTLWRANGANKKGFFRFLILMMSHFYDAGDTENSWMLNRAKLSPVQGRNESTLRGMREYYQNTKRTNSVKRRTHRAQNKSWLLEMIANLNWTWRGDVDSIYHDKMMSHILITTEWFVPDYRNEFENNIDKSISWGRSLWWGKKWHKTKNFKKLVFNCDLMVWQKA